MGKPLHPLVQEAQAAFRDNVDAILAVRDMKRVHLADKGDRNKKTVYNVLDLEHPAKLESMARMAQRLGVPLWVLMIPGLHEHRELLKEGALKPLQAVVLNYLKSSPQRRADIEETARSSARLSSQKT